jgi:hypothetical protein
MVHTAGEVVPGFYKSAVEVKNDQPAFSIHGLFRTIRSRERGCCCWRGKPQGNPIRFTCCP